MLSFEQKSLILNLDKAFPHSLWFGKRWKIREFSLRLNPEETFLHETCSVSCGFFSWEDRLSMGMWLSELVLQMDRASILGDAIDYLKELLQRINDLHNELESTQPGALPPPTNFHALTPTPPTLPCRVKEELGPSSLPSPKGQPPRVPFSLIFCSRSNLI